MKNANCPSVILCFNLCAIQCNDHSEGVSINTVGSSILSYNLVLLVRDSGPQPFTVRMELVYRVTQAMLMAVIRKPSSFRVIFSPEDAA